MNRPDISHHCSKLLPVGFRNEDEPVFRQPWQAQAFALAVHLIESGTVSLNQWSATLGEEIAEAARHGIAEDGSGYYELWLRALERLVTGARLVDASELDQLEEAWRQAYRETPHGQPVRLNQY